jgi:hypothetical protein
MVLTMDKVEYRPLNQVQNRKCVWCVNDATREAVRKYLSVEQTRDATAPKISPALKWKKTFAIYCGIPFIMRSCLLPRRSLSSLRTTSAGESYPEPCDGTGLPASVLRLRTMPIVRVQGSQWPGYINNLQAGQVLVHNSHLSVMGVTQELFLAVQFSSIPTKRCRHGEYNTARGDWW